jgi:hypothetical protein
MADMMKMHEQMMAEMKTGDAKLDALVRDMNAAAGDAKVKAMAAVRQRTGPATEGYARAHGPNASADDGARG